MSSTSAYREFTGKSVEEALRLAREAFGVGLDDLDFEILTPGSRGVLGMGAEPARIVAAPRSALGGAAPKRDAAASQPLPAQPPREERGGFGDRDRDRGPRREGGFDRDRGPRPERGPPGSGSDCGRRGPGEGRPGGGGFRGAPASPESRGGERLEMTASEIEEVNAARGSLAAERADLEAAEASPEALKAGQQLLEELMRHLGFDVLVQVDTRETSRLNVVGEGDEKEALGALIGRTGERLSALQPLVNLMLSRKMNAWTRVLVD